MLSKLCIIMGIVIVLTNYPLAIYLLTQIKNVEDSSKNVGRFIGWGCLVLSTLFSLGFFFLSNIV